MSKFATKHENVILAGFFSFLIFVVAVASVSRLALDGSFLIAVVVSFAGVVASYAIFRGVAGTVDYAEFKRDALTLIRKGN